MEHCWFELPGREFGIGDLDAGGIGVGIDFGLNAQAGAGGRVADELDDDLKADEWSSAPILGDMAEHPVRDLVPFARPRWAMAHRDSQAGRSGQTLQLDLPP